MKIGFIGLGIMGSRMAASLQKHGHSLVVLFFTAFPTTLVKKHDEETDLFLFDLNT